MTDSGRILVIDDDSSLRQTLARILRRDGYEVITAANATEGLSLLSQQALDLIYMDIRMPDMDGLEALKAVRSRLPELPVILFTAQPDLNSALEALRNGANDYLLKPLKPEMILERTRTTFEKLERERRKDEIQSQITNLQAELQELETVGLTEKDSSKFSNVFPKSDRYFTCGKLILDLHARRINIDDNSFNLSSIAFDYLLVLARHSPNAVDYQTLVAEAQGYQVEPHEAQRLSKWYVHHIRKAIEQDTKKPTYLINVRGVGYRLVVD